MLTVKQPRWGGWAAVAGGLLGLVLAPATAAATIWSYQPYTGWVGEVPPVPNLLRFYIEPLLRLAPPNDVYPTFGRLLLPVFVLLLVGVLGLRAGMAGQSGRSLHAGLSLMLAGGVMQVLGNFFDYWLGEDVLGQAIWALTFGVGTLIGVIVFAAGSIILCFVLLHRALLPWWAAVPLGVWPVLGLGFLCWGVIHIPSSWVFPMSAAWLLVGIALLLPKRDSASVTPFAPNPSTATD